MPRSVRRLLAIVLLAVPFQAPSMAFAASADHGRGRCSDHVCACRHHCAPKKKPVRRCHGGAATETEASFKSLCRHGQEAANPVAVRPHVMPAPLAYAPAAASQGLSVPLRAHASAGFLDIDLPPPRTQASL
jgi:hypothetical protein